MKNTVKLNETQLKKIVAESVKGILKEFHYSEEGEIMPDNGDFYKGEPYVAGDNPFADHDTKIKRPEVKKPYFEDEIEMAKNMVDALNRKLYSMTREVGSRMVDSNFERNVARLQKAIKSARNTLGALQF